MLHPTRGLTKQLPPACRTDFRANPEALMGTSCVGTKESRSPRRSLALAPRLCPGTINRHTSCRKSSPKGRTDTCSDRRGHQQENGGTGNDAEKQEDSQGRRGKVILFVESSSFERKSRSRLRPAKCSHRPRRWAAPSVGAAIRALNRAYLVTWNSPTLPCGGDGGLSIQVR